MERKIKGIAALFCAFVLLFVSGCFNDYLDDTDDVIYNGAKYIEFIKHNNDVWVQQNEDVFVGHLHTSWWRPAFRVYANKEDTEFNVLFAPRYIYVKEGFEWPRIEKLEVSELDILFEEFHNERYLRQCYYNLQEKYDDGIIPEEEWKKLDFWYSSCLI